MNIKEQHSWEGRPLIAIWHDATFNPPRNLITQASGICFTEERRIVLVTSDGESWSLPGGHPEDTEGAEAAFIREVSEEACATVTNLFYLGAQEVNDPTDTNALSYYQTRFWARVRLEDFKPRHETTGRKLVTPECLNASLRWNPHQILDAILQAALEREREFRSRTY